MMNGAIETIYVFGEFKIDVMIEEEEEEEEYAFRNLKIRT
jgi:hypothetical protein